MLAFLDFIFQDFTHWIGTAVLLSIIFGGIGETIKSFKDEK